MDDFLHLIGLELSCFEQAGDTFDDYPAMVVRARGQFARRNRAIRREQTRSVRVPPMSTPMR